MNHRTQVLQTSTGFTGICSCGYYTPDTPGRNAAAIAVNDHFIAAAKTGVKVTHLGEPEVKTIKR